MKVCLYYIQKVCLYDVYNLPVKIMQWTKSSEVLKISIQNHVSMFLQFMHNISFLWLYQLFM